MNQLARDDNNVMIKFKDHHRDNLLDILVSDFMISNYSGILTYYYVTGKPSIHLYPVRKGQTEFTYTIWKKGKLRQEKAPSKDYVWKLPAEQNGGLMADSLDSLLAGISRSVQDPDCCREKSRLFMEEHLTPIDPGERVCQRIGDAVRRLVGN